MFVKLEVCVRGKATDIKLETLCFVDLKQF